MGGDEANSTQVSNYYKENSGISKAETVEQLFVSRHLHPDLDPAKFKNGIRESRDSVGCPNSKPVAFGFDETGSMGRIPFYFVQEGFPKLINMIQGRVLGYGAQVAVVAIGDVKYDEAPLQFSQFEADTRMIDHMRLFYIEGMGGDNEGESYQLPWWALARHTEFDALSRGEKGIYISVGDDKPHPLTTREQIKKVFGSYDGLEKNSISTTEIRDLALEKYHLFHVLIRRHMMYASDNVEETWKSLLGNHIAILDNYEYVAEVMATMLKIQSGMDKYDAVSLIEDPMAKSYVRMALQDFEPYDESLGVPKTGEIEII